VRRFAALTLVALGILSGVTANAADDLPPLPAMPPNCTGELQAADATLTTQEGIIFHVEVPGWLRCDTERFAVALFGADGGNIAPRSIKDAAPGGYTTFTVIKQNLGVTAGLCLMPEVAEGMYAKHAVSCVRLVRNGNSVTLVKVPWQEFRSPIPIELAEDVLPPAPECSNCW
jgi:hypothetical protein